MKQIYVGAVTRIQEKSGVVMTRGEAMTQLKRVLRIIYEIIESNAQAKEKLDPVIPLLPIHSDLDTLKQIARVYRPYDKNDRMLRLCRIASGLMIISEHYVLF